MAAIDLPPLRADDAVTDAAGRPTRRLFRWIAAVTARLGGDTDKVDAAYALGASAAPASVNVVGAGGLQGGGTLSGDVGLTLWRAVTGVAALPASGNATGDLAYAIDGRKPGEAAGAGTGVPVFWSHGAWYSLCSGAVVTS